MKSGKKRLAPSIAAGLTLVAALCISPAAVLPADAAEDCSSTWQSYHSSGISAYSTSIYGASAAIETNLPALCDHVPESGYVGSQDAVAAWSMVTPDSPYHWAQSGYVRIGSEHPWAPEHMGTVYFAQWTKSCNPSCGAGDAGVVTAWGGAPASWNTYSSYLRASDDRVHMTVGGNDLGVMGYDVTGIWPASWRVEVSGETHNLGSDMPGDAADHTNFSSILKYNSTGGTSEVQTLTPGNPAGSRYHVDLDDTPSGGNTMEIWTSPMWSE